MPVDLSTLEEVSFKGETARLRAGNAMPTRTIGRFVLHTFLVEVNEVDFVTCTTELPSSSEFRGQAACDSEEKVLISAQFSRLNVVGGEVFSGKKVYNPTYREESYLN